MPTTPTYLLPYPAPTDTPDVPRDVQALAVATETTLKGKQPSTYDSGWQTNAAHITDVTYAAPNPAGTWTTEAVNYRRIGSVVDLSFTAFWKGAAWPGRADGNIGNVTIGVFNPLGATIVGSAWAPKHPSALSTSYTGPVAALCIHPDGRIQISALVPNVTIPGTGTKGTQFDIQGIYFIA